MIWLLITGFSGGGLAVWPVIIGNWRCLFATHPFPVPALIAEAQAVAAQKTGGWAESAT